MLHKISYSVGYDYLTSGCLRTAVRVVMVDIVGADHSHIAEGWSLTYTGIIYLGLFPLAGRYSAVASLVWMNDFVRTIVVAILSFGQNFSTRFLPQSLSNRLEI